MDSNFASLKIKFKANMADITMAAGSSNVYQNTHKIGKLY